MLTKRYLSSAKNVVPIMQKIVTGTAPERFTNEHLKNIGFGSSSDRAIIPILKDLSFLTSDGAPTTRYHEYRNSAKSKKVLGEALKEVYAEVFHINTRPTKSDKAAIEGVFKSSHNVTDRVAELQAATFFAFLDMADVTDSNPSNVATIVSPSVTPETRDSGHQQLPSTLSLRYNIEIHLPATKDIEVYNAIFKSLKENLGY